MAVVGGAILLALVLPLLISLNRFQRQVRHTLEAEFGRRVSLGAMSLRLLPSVGIDADYVTVDEDPAFGAEPFIRAEKLACDVNPWRLWKGRVEFSRLAFTRPSINLVKNAAGRWNLAAFLEQAGARGPSGRPARARFAALLLDDARFNFKVRDEKKVYGLVSTDARLERAANGRWKLDLEGTPFRSDRALTETGTLRLRGELGPFEAGYSELPFEFHLRVEKTQLADLLVLFLGREYGVLGRIKGEAHLQGTPRDFRAEGDAQVGDVHRWDLLASPRAPVWHLRYRLAVDATTGTVRLDELDGRTAASRFHATGNFLPWSTPRKWEFRLAPLELALPDLWAVYAAFRKGVDQAAEAPGAASGALIWSGPDHALEGLLDWQGVALRTKSLPAGVDVARFRTEFHRDHASLRNLSVTFRSLRAGAGARESLDVAGSWSRGRPASTVQVRLASRGLGLEPLTALARGVGLDFAPGTELAGTAGFAVELRWRLAADQRLTRSGWIELLGVALRAPRLNEAITVKQARLEFAGSRGRVAPLAAVVAGANVTGSLAFATGHSWTCEFSLAADRIETDRLDQLLNPRRRERSRLGVSLPTSPAVAASPAAGADDFFAQLRARGQLTVGEVRLGWLGLENLRAQVNYNGRHVRLEKLAFGVLEGRFSGEAQLDFVNPPGYRLTGQLDRTDLGTLLEAAGRSPARYRGIFSARGQLETTGTGKGELLANLVGRGAFIVEEGRVARFNLQEAISRAAGLPVASGGAPDTEVHSLSGELFVAERNVRFKSAVLTVPGASMLLEGVADLEGRLNFSLRIEPLPATAGTGPPLWPAELFDHRYRVLGTLREPDVRLGGTAQARR